MSPAGKRGRKPPNGSASSNTYLLTFDIKDEGERKAWEVAQQLASDRKLKSVLISLLLAIHTIQTQTRKTIDVVNLASRLIAGLVFGPTQPTISLQAETEYTTPVIGSAQTGDQVEARKNMVKSMDNGGSFWD